MTELIGNLIRLTAVYADWLVWTGTLYVSYVRLPGTVTGYRGHVKRGRQVYYL